MSGAGAGMAPSTGERAGDGVRHRRVTVGAGTVGFDLYEAGPGGGPVITLLGGVHGDEAEGMLAASLALDRLGSQVEHGTLRVVPVCNERAAARRERALFDDGGDLARAFPGDSGGLLVERLAAHLAAEAIAGSALLVDLHSAGIHYEMPLLVGATSGAGADGGAPTVDIGSEDAARTLAAPVLWLHEWTPPGRTLSCARDLGIPSLYVEHPGGPGVSPPAVDRTVRGVRRLLAAHGMLADADEPETSQLVLRGNGDLDHNNLRISSAGLLWPLARAGEAVDTGAPLGRVHGPDGRIREEVCAKEPGVVVMMRRSCAVEPGDRIATIVAAESP